MIVFLLLLYWSPGTIEPFLDEEGNVLEGSVAEIVRLPIGGIEQGMIIRGKSDKNPVMLFLHGGPGFPFPTNTNLAELEKYFTVCWWQQRGSGMSYDSEIETKTMTLDQFLSDTAEVSNYLRERFDQEQIYLMGHSWGSFLGIHATAKFPELYAAYICVGLPANQFESEKIAYTYMLEAARSAGDKKLEQDLLQYTLDSPASISTDYLILRSNGLDKLGVGGTRNVDSDSAHSHNVISSGLSILRDRPEYTIGDKINNMRGVFFSLEYLYPELVKQRLSDTIPRLEIPVYMLQGEYDYITNYNLAKEYYDVLDAPLKQFYTFNQSAHGPYSDEPEKFMQIIKEEILLNQ